MEKNIPELSSEWKMTEEEAGRKARYQEFEAIAQKEGAGVTAVAHHQNDVAETLLMNLLRGSGLHGAGSIRPVRGNIIRPLLCVNRKEIEDYLSELGQSYCQDATNSENNHTRNVIRNLLIPAMEKDVNSKAVDHLCRAAEGFLQADEYIRAESEKLFELLAKETGEGIVIDLNKLRTFADVVKADFLLLCLEKLTPARKDITSAHIDAVLRLCEGMEGSASCDLPYGLVAIRSYDELEICQKDIKNSRKNNKEYLIPKQLETGAEITLKIPDLGVAHISIIQYSGGKLFPISAYTKWFDYDRIQGAIFRKRQSEDYIYLEMDGALRKKKISKLMTDEKIPRHKRDELFLLADGNNVIWIPGYRMSGAYKVSETTNKILAINIDNGGNTNG